MIESTGILDLFLRSGRYHPSLLLPPLFLGRFDFPAYPNIFKVELYAVCLSLDIVRINP